MIENVIISDGAQAEDTLYLKPHRQEVIRIDPEIAVAKVNVRQDIAATYVSKYGRQPLMFVFLSHRFIDKNKHKSTYDEQARTLAKIKEAIESAGCAVIEADEPGHGIERHYDNYVYTAVFSRLWASDACLVLALDEDGGGKLSPSIGHEIGFLAGRGKPLKVFVSKSCDQDPVFGNTVGKNRITYPDGDSAFVDDDADALFHRVKAWLQAVLLRPVPGE